VSEVLEASSHTESEVIQRWPTPRAKTWLARFLSVARQDENIAAVIAVGSAIRRSATPPVDLDLVVLARDLKKVKVKPPIEVDLRPYPLGQVDSMIVNGSDLLGWAVTFGKLLVQRDLAWDRILVKWKDRLPLPSAEVAKKRAADALRRFKSMVEVGDEDAALEQTLSYVTHRARSELSKRNVYPASRREIPGQLRQIGSEGLADSLQQLIDRAAVKLPALVAIVEAISRH
jgi:hypothetical protein